MAIDHTSLSAWAVLNDAEHALNYFETSSTEQDYRIYWWAIMSLLRAAGHVLDKVDGKNHPDFGRLQEEWWRSEGKHDPIFVGFIENDRNELLKKYAFQAAPAALADRNGSIVTDRLGRTITTRQWFLSVGPFAGRAASAVAREAIAWWRRKIIALADTHQA